MCSTLKRISAWALTVVMLVGLFALPVAKADDVTVTLGLGTIEKTQVDNADAWKVPVIVKAPAGQDTYDVRAVQIYVTFDKDALELVKLEAGAIPDTYDEDEEKSFPIELQGTGKKARTEANEAGCYEAVFVDVAKNKLNHKMNSGDPIMTMYFKLQEGKSGVVTVKAPESGTYADSKQRISRYVGEAYEPYTVVAEQSETISDNNSKTKYTVKFVNDDGTELSSQQYDEGTAAAAITLPANPTKAPANGKTYTFKEWTPAIADVTADATYTATYTDDPTPGADGACYVATAVYGSYDCPQVWTLRRFRDDVLAQTWYGRLFIKAYYAVSPTCVKLFGDTEMFQNFFRGVLDPWVAELQEEGFESTPYNDTDW